MAKHALRYTDDVIENVYKFCRGSVGNDSVDYFSLGECHLVEINLVSDYDDSVTDRK